VDIPEALKLSQDSQVTTGDFNGDGLSDILLIQKNEENGVFKNNLKIYFSKGDFTFEIKTYDREREDYLDPSDIIIPADINGDGVSDFVRHRRTDYRCDVRQQCSEIYYFISKGDGTFRELDVFGFLGADVNINVIPVDINGDGVSDFISQNYFSQPTIFMNKAKKSKITSIKKGIAKQYDIKYLPMSSREVYTAGDVKAGEDEDILLSSMDMVKEYTISINGEVEENFYYYYEGAKVNNKGRGFLGFRRVDAADVKRDVRKEITYRQDFPYVGRIDTSKLIDSMYFSWDDAEVLESTSYEYDNYYSGDRAKAYSPKRTAKTERKNGFEMRTEYESSYGVIQETYEMGDVNDPSDDIRTVIELEDQNKVGRFGLVKSMSTYNSDKSKLLSKKEYHYDTNLNIIAIDDLYEEGKAPRRTSYEYDHYGNLIKISSPNGVEKNMKFDDTGIYLQELFYTNPINGNILSSTKFVTDKRFGLKKQQTDPNGNVVEYEYDGFGRLVSSKIPDNSGELVEVEKVFYALECSGNIIKRKLIRPGWKDDEWSSNGYDDGLYKWSGNIEWYWTEEEVDPFGRKVKTVTKGVDGKKIISRKEYSALKVVETLPHYSSTAGEDIQITVNKTDKLGRAVSSKSRYGTFKIEYMNKDENSEGRKVVKTAPDGSVTTEILNSKRSYSYSVIF